MGIHKPKFTTKKNLLYICLSLWFAYFNCKSLISFIVLLFVFCFLSVGGGVLLERFIKKGVNGKKNVFLRHNHINLSSNCSFFVKYFKYLYFLIPFICYLIVICVYPFTAGHDQVFEVNMGINGNPYTTYKTIFITLVYKLLSLNGSHWGIYVFCVAIFLAYAVYYTITNSQTMFDLKNKTCILLSIFLRLELSFLSQLYILKMMFLCQ